MSNTYRRAEQPREERAEGLVGERLQYSFRHKRPGRVTLSDRQTKSVKEVSAEVVRLMLLDKCPR